MSGKSLISVRSLSFTDGRCERGGRCRLQQAPVEEPASREHQEEFDCGHRSLRRLRRGHAGLQRLEEERLRRVLQVRMRVAQVTQVANVNLFQELRLQQELREDEGRRMVRLVQVDECSAGETVIAGYSVS